jgi:hypothetical protein
VFTQQISGLKLDFEELFWFMNLTLTLKVWEKGILSPTVQYGWWPDFNSGIMVLQ